MSCAEAALPYETLLRMARASFEEVLARFAGKQEATMDMDVSRARKRSTGSWRIHLTMSSLDLE